MRKGGRRRESKGSEGKGRKLESRGLPTVPYKPGTHTSFSSPEALGSWALGPAALVPTPVTLTYCHPSPLRHSSLPATSMGFSNFRRSRPGLSAWRERQSCREFVAHVK